VFALCRSHGYKTRLGPYPLLRRCYHGPESRDFLAYAGVLSGRLRATFHSFVLQGWDRLRMLRYVATNPMSEATKAREGVRVLCLLALLNLISIADRYVVPDVQPLIKSEFHLSDSAVGTLSSAFFLTFMASMPIAIWCGRRAPCKIMTCGAALLWSCFTLFSAMSKSYGALLINHSLFAIGEASFAIFAPVVIADFYPADKRHRAMTVFSLTVPVGTAAAFAMASLAHHDGWRLPLYWLAAIGALAAGLSAMLMNTASQQLEVPSNRLSPRNVILSLVLNPKYLATVVGGCCLAFSMVGLAVWLPTLLTRSTGLPLAEVNRVLSLTTLVNGVLGVLLG
jgi:MFS family permease